MIEPLRDGWVFFTSNLPPFTAVGGVIAALIPFYQFMANRMRDAKNREFEIYHRLIKEIVQGDGPDTYQHRQAAAVFELRNFKRYQAVTHRLLKPLKAKWALNPNTQPFLLDELGLTIHATRKRWYQFWRKG